MASGPRRCRIEEVFGADGVCPEEPCPFWEKGVAGFGGCAFDKVDLGTNPQVAEWLLHVRTIIEAERR